MSGDELQDKARKIDTSGGDYQEGGQQQRVEVNVGSGSDDARYDTQRKRDIGKLLEAIVTGNGGVTLTRISELKKTFPDFADDIDGAVQGALINHNVQFDRRLTRVERKVNAVFILLCVAIGCIMILLLIQLTQGGAMA